MSYLEAATKTTNSNPDKNHYSPHKKNHRTPKSFFLKRIIKITAITGMSCSVPS